MWGKIADNQLWLTIIATPFHQINLDPVSASLRPSQITVVLSVVLEHRVLISGLSPLPTLSLGLLDVGNVLIGVGLGGHHIQTCLGPRVESDRVLEGVEYPEVVADLETGGVMHGPWSSIQFV